MRGNPLINGLLLDLDGVIYIGSELIAGAAGTLAQLNADAMPFRFITNTTTNTPGQLLQKLSRLGLNARAEQVFSAVAATQRYLGLQGRPSCHLLVADAVKSCFAEFPSNDDNPDFVVIGDIGTHWNYEILNKVFNMLMRGAKLVCMHRNKYWQTETGLRMDIGAFVAALEYTTGVEATVIGKPARTYFEMALSSLQLPAAAVAVVGDDIESDIGGGQLAGLQGILVQTGKYRAELAHRSAVKPDHVISSIAVLPELLMRLRRAGK